MFVDNVSKNHFFPCSVPLRDAEREQKIRRDIKQKLSFSQINTRTGLAMLCIED